MDKFLNTVDGKAVKIEDFMAEIGISPDSKWKPVIKKALALPKIGDFIPPKAGSDVNIFGRKTPAVLYPILPNMVFRSLSEIKSPENVKVVMFGQDPYPRRESAIGLSFCDGNCKSWNSPLPPSLRNLLKCILINRKVCKIDTKLDDMRRYVSKIGLPQVQEWFAKLNSAEYGVMWLNTALTFTGKDSTELSKNLTFWKPVIDGIIAAIAAKSENVVWVLMGGKAQVLEKTIRKAYSDVQIPKYQIVKSAHPAYDDPFYKTILFDDIYVAQKKLNIEPTDWLLGHGDKIEN